MIPKSKHIANSIMFIGIFCTASVSANETIQYEQHSNIIRSVKQFITQHIQKTHQGKFSIRVGRIDPRHRLRRCTQTLKAHISGNNSSNAITVGVRCEKPSPWLLYVPGKISIIKSVYVARHTMNRGHRINISDIQLIDRDIAQLHYGYIDKQHDIVGKLTRRVVFAKTVIKPQMLTLPLSVRRGQNVTLIAETHGIQVRMSGKALGSAPVGQSIRVRNLSSKRIVEGVVIRTGVVKISM